MMTGELLFALATRIEDVFALIGGAILLIELAEAAFKRTLFKGTLTEMLISASTQIPYLLVEVLILSAGYGLFYLLSDWAAIWTIPTSMWWIVLAVILADLTYYWEHRIAHDVRLLWTQHAVHHSSRDMNIITGIRFGPLEGVWSLIAHVPMVLIGFSPDVVLFSLILVLAYQTWLHTELIGKLGWLERVLNTPSHHRVHHGSDEKYLDRNFGGILIVWDRMFGTFQVEQETPRYGLKRDFNSRNPLRVWFSELPGLWHDLRAARSWREAWMRLFGPPGWEPGGR